MRYTLYLKMLSRSNLPTQTFSSVDDAIDAAVKIKAACTKEERKELAMFIMDDEGGMSATNTEIAKAYCDLHPLDQ